MEWRAESIAEQNMWCVDKLISLEHPVYHLINGMYGIFTQSSNSTMRTCLEPFGQGRDIYFLYGSASCTHLGPV